MLVLYLLLRVQGSLPLSLGFPGVAPDQAFNTAVSFVTNTNWQSYAGESTMGHLVQMSGLAVQNFVSAAVGIAIAVALIRGFVRRESETIGNFWADLVRSIVRILLPIAIVGAVVLISQGVVQNFDGAQEITTVQGATQSIPGGPVASQEVIKELGTNGGGFYNANSAHPFENPNPFTNLLEMVLLLVVPFALTGTFGKMVGNRKQGYVLAAVMALLWLGSTMLTWQFESQAESSGASGGRTAVSGGNLEGKEVRFGIPASGAFAAATTGTSTGAVIASHDSFTPFGGGVVLVNMMLSEVSPGGVGSGLYGILVLAIVAVFIAGLMVGRTPEYLGKKIEPREMKLVSLYILLVPAIVLVLTGAAVVMGLSRRLDLQPGTPTACPRCSMPSPRGPTTTAARSAACRRTPPSSTPRWGSRCCSAGSPRSCWCWGWPGRWRRRSTSRNRRERSPRRRRCSWGLLTGVIIIVTALTYFPALSLGPIVEGLS